MTRVDSDAWIPKAKKRKAYRDQNREKFFRKVGIKKGAHIQEFTGAPASQASYLRDLAQLTADGSILQTDQRNMIATLDQALDAVGLGAGAMGSTAATQAHLDRYSMKNLRDHWFWSPAFFD